MSKSDKKILVVDDEKKIVDVIESYLANSGYDVYKVYDGKGALEAHDRVEPSLIILDLMLPDLRGEDICKSIRIKSKVPIIMLTAKVEEEDILRGLDIGADDYINKPFSPKQLVARVKALLRRTEGEDFGIPDILNYNNGDLIINCQSYEVKSGGELAHLTPNEFRILLTLAKHPQRVFGREELVLKALGEDYDGFDRAIDTHIKNLRKKIEPDSKNPRYILTIHGIGYRFGGE